MTNNTRTSTIKYGIIRLQIAPILDFEIPDATNRFTAIGGVIIPIDVLITMIIPITTRGNTDSAPYWGNSVVAIGAKIGVINNMIDCVSRNIPRNRRIRLTIKRSMILFPENAPIIAFAIIAGRFSCVINHANGAERPMTNMTTAELTAESLKIPYKSLKEQSL